MNTEEVHEKIIAEVVSAVPLEEYVYFFSTKRIQSRTLLFFIKIVEKIVGARLLIELPDEYQGATKNLLEAYRVADTLRGFKMINRITLLHRTNSDEPPLYRANIGNLASGGNFTDPTSALWAGLAESYERHLWYHDLEWVDCSLIHASYAELKPRALDIFSLAGFSDDQRVKHVNLQFNENSKFGWVSGYSAIQKKAVYCPAQLVSSKYDSKSEPLLRWKVTTGLASGRTSDEAIYKGILEVIEREAFMVAYYNGLSTRQYDLGELARNTDDSELEMILNKFARHNLEVYALELPNEFSVYTTMGIVIDRTGLGPAIAVAASAHANERESILKALSEALHVRYELKEHWKTDFDAKNIGREERVRLWAKFENIDRLDFMLHGEKIKKFKDTTASANNYSASLKNLLEIFKNKNFEVCYVPLSTRKKIHNLESVFVVIPALCPLHLIESLPYTEDARLRSLPKMLGYKTSTVPGLLPHPFP